MRHLRRRHFHDDEDDELALQAQLLLVQLDAAVGAIAATLAQKEDDDQ